ncbi:hypothetical protein COLO4_33203 [Corchorus olitorius]|uniref:Uncharacterized protein n=1 Tax=Corchorus olitorius TaxID=93759 RepID=A0A1R3GVW4_9ROSI|nr:hypothetical protein COLO4_33203 [Corchorus olitorius]
MGRVNCKKSCFRIYSRNLIKVGKDEIVSLIPPD